MSCHDGAVLSSTEMAEAAENYRRRLRLCSTLFLLFFVFYVGAAVIQTPALGSIAGIVVFGMPLGLFLSLMIFPVSWLIIAVFFLRWR